MHPLGWAISVKGGPLCKPSPLLKNRTLNIGAAECIDVNGLEHTKYLSLYLFISLSILSPIVANEQGATYHSGSTVTGPTDRPCHQSLSLFLFHHWSATLESPLGPIHTQRERERERTGDSGNRVASAVWAWVPMSEGNIQ